MFIGPLGSKVTKNNGSLAHFWLGLDCLDCTNFKLHMAWYGRGVCANLKDWCFRPLKSL